MSLFGKKEAATSATPKKKSDVEALADKVADLTAEVRKLTRKRDAEAEALELTETINSLKTELSDLRIRESEVKEKHDREKREVEHMVGLERKRQEFEVSQARREAEVEVKSQNLEADRKRFEDQMKFMQDRLTEEVKYLKDDILKAVLDRLPTVTVDRSISESTKSKS